MKKSKKAQKKYNEQVKQQALRDHIKELNNTEYMDDPIYDDVETWNELGVYTPAQLDDYISAGF